jgi:hypothetical protein
VFGFLDPYGVGRTTTLRTVIGLLHPTLARQDRWAGLLAGHQGQAPGGLRARRASRARALRTLEGPGRCLPASDREDP